MRFTLVLLTVDRATTATNSAGWVDRTAREGLDPRTHDPWERTSYVPNVVLSCGALLEEHGTTVRLYWGAADTVVCTGIADLHRLIALCQDPAQG